MIFCAFDGVKIICVLFMDGFLAWHA